MDAKMKIRRIMIYKISAAYYVLFAFVLFAIMVTTTSAQTTEFTYQGKLTVQGTQTPTYDFEFYLCDSSTANCDTPLAVNARPGVVVLVGGTFSVGLDFGDVNLNGSDLFLEIRVKRSSESTYTTLAPREKITSVPYAVQARRSEDSNRLGGSLANAFVVTTDPRLDAIRNTTTLQPGVNFNIGGTGTADILSATTQFNIGSDRVIGISGSGNIFAGRAAGANNQAGGNDNAFFGASSGLNNSIGDGNSFFGRSSGQNNLTGIQNSFVGRSAGHSNTTGNFNTFFGGSAGFANSSGGNNTFLGYSSGINSLGGSNTFVGNLTGDGNTVGNSNTLIGAGANVTVNNLSFATAIGAGATVSQGSSVVLGRPSDIVRVPGILNTQQFYFNGARFLEASGNNVLVGYSAGSNITGVANTLLGSQTGTNLTSGSSNVFIGFGSGNASVATQVSNSVAIGNGVRVSTSDTIALGTDTQATLIAGKLRVTGGYTLTSGSSAHLQTVDSTNSIWGAGTAVSTLHIQRAPQVFQDNPLCVQTGSGVPVIGYQAVGYCPDPFSQSSLKTQTKRFDGGLEILKQLQPTSFKWKDHDSGGIGLDAEDIAAVDPQLVSRDDKGEITKVSQSALIAVAINAIKEQQKQIEAQKIEIAALKKLICASTRDAVICTEKVEKMLKPE
jgi:hypothetical protein